MVIIDEKEYLTSTEFANEVSKSWTTIDNYVRRGLLIPDVVIGKHKYFLPEKLEQFTKGYIVPFKKTEN